MKHHEIFPPRDNQTIVAKGETEAFLRHVLNCCPTEVVSVFKADEDAIRFHPYSPREDGFSILPCPLKPCLIINLILQWLQHRAVYPEQPDIDGDLYRGWKIKIGTHGSDGIVVKPHWMICHV